MITDKFFFDTVRPLFTGGRLNQLQVEGLEKIVKYADENEYTPEETAFMLGQIFHETAQWMQPLREGARRFGPNNYTDAQARAAVTSIYNKGIIRRNYALPDGPYRQSYYGRGLIQITWYDNYRKFTNILGKPLDQNPDLALDWKISLDIAFIGCRDGVFRSKGMGDFEFPRQFREARDIVNGDVSTQGAPTARYANVFLTALKNNPNVAHDYPTTPPVVEPVVEPVNRPRADVYKDLQRQLQSIGAYTGRIDGIWGPLSQGALTRFEKAEPLINKLKGEL